VSEKTEQVVVIGGGPAGYTAALYAARARREPVVIEGYAPGGLIQETTGVENFPGYPRGVLGPNMMQDFRDQAERFGARFVTDQAKEVSFSSEPGGVHEIRVNGDVWRASAVILAMGARPRKLGVPNEEELGGHGIAYCAVCDAPFFGGRETVVVGGGDSAMEETSALAKYASKVTVIHRRGEFRASRIMYERARDEEKVGFLTPYVVEGFLATEQGTLAGVQVRNAETDEQGEIEATGAFVAIGHEPQSELVRGKVEVDKAGYVVTNGSTSTNVAGVFAAGDLVDHTYRQAVTAAGSGCQAALDAERYLQQRAG
jgi:thioredoxin reductase (NADPH)